MHRFQSAVENCLSIISVSKLRQTRTRQHCETIIQSYITFIIRHAVLRYANFVGICLKFRQEPLWQISIKYKYIAAASGFNLNCCFLAYKGFYWNMNTNGSWHYRRSKSAIKLNCTPKVTTRQTIKIRYNITLSQYLNNTMHI